MKKFVKLLALNKSLFVSASISIHSAGNLGYGINLASWYTTWHATMSVVNDILTNNTADESKYRDMIMSKEGETLDEIVNLACLSTMNNYNKILSIVENGDVIQPKINVDWNKTIRKLFIFTFEELQGLKLMNRRFRLFYFLRVHELLTFGSDEKSMIDFYNLVKTLGDLECYNQLFVGNIPLELVDTYVPRDVAKIILDYSNLSIYDPDDILLIGGRCAPPLPPF
jgi:hypothetical protein